MVLNAGTMIGEFQKLLVIGDTCFALIFYEDEQNNIYMTRKQISEALEYKEEKSITQIHNRNKDLDNQSVRIKAFNNVCQTDIPFPTNLHPESLLYNEDGIYEITFLSRQPKANEFRAWVRERIKEM